jgi:uncharacterized protein
MSGASFNRPMLGFGQVRHKRLRPVVNAFAYPGYFLMLPMRTLRNQASPSKEVLAINRPGCISFHDGDHGDGRGVGKGGALLWIDEMLASAGINDATGEAWLLCYPRVLGYAFKPVSFWYCHRAPDDQGGALRAIVVEVNNTFGERHCYLLDAPHWGQELLAQKMFHVSPFFDVRGQYRFRFMRSDDTARRDAQRLVARIDYEDEEGALLQTSISGALQPVTPAGLRRAFWRYPAMTFGVVFHIHWQALRLWLKRVAFFAKPNPPGALVTGQISAAPKRAPPPSSTEIALP